MKVGIISDIHSNYRAFKVCLDFFEKENVDYYLLLGDYVSDTPCPEKVMKMIYELRQNHRVYMVRGNREDYFIDDRHCDKGWIDSSAAGNLLYTRERLTEGDLDFFESLPVSDKFCIDGYPSLTFCHGSPASTREHIYMNTDVSNRWLSEIDTDYLISGHTHQRCKCSMGGKTYINTGSCGIPIHNAGRAECVMLTGITKDNKSDWCVEMLSIPYDVRDLVDEIFSSGLYDRGHWFINSNIQTLMTGIDRASDMVCEAHRLAGMHNDYVSAGIPSEKCFELAAKTLGVPEYGTDRNPVHIRMADEEDAKALLDIYSYYIENTAVTFEYDVPTEEEFRNRIFNIRQSFPYYVAEKDGKIMGYAYASKFRTRAAYGWNSELSIYIDKNAHRMGIGTLLLDAVESTLRRQGIVNFYAIASDSSEQSNYIPGEGIPFYKKHGYEEEGRLTKVGVKFGKWFDTVYMVKRLHENVDNPANPQPYFTKQK